MLANFLLRASIVKYRDVLFFRTAFTCAHLHDEPSFGSILRVLTLSGAAFAVAMVLAGRPAWLRVFK